MRAGDATFTLKGKRIDNVLYPVEESRGYQARGDLWSPGYFRLTLRAGRAGDAGRLHRIVRDDDGARRRRRRSTRSAAGAGGCSRRRRPSAREGVAAELVLAADQFIITPAGRTEEAARARASGDEVRTVIAGYHWFTDWGRDTMISLEGLTLVDRPPRRGRLHPAHVRALRARRPDPEHVSRGREGRAVSHRRRDAVVLPRRRRATSTASGDRLTLALLYPDAEADRRLPRARHALRHPRRSSATAC